MSLSQDDLGIMEDQYVQMTSPMPGYKSPPPEVRRPNTPGSKSLNDVKHMQIKKPKASLWKRGKRKIAKWSSSTNVSSSKAEPSAFDRGEDTHIDDDELEEDYIQMGRKKHSSPAILEHRISPETRSLGDLLDCYPQDQYDAPRSQTLTQPPLPPRPATKFPHGSLLRHPYEECAIGQKAQGDSDWDTRSTITTISLSRDEGLLSQLEDTQKYVSTSESYSLQDLGASITLPQFLRVTKGFYSANEDESLSDGDLLVAYCTKTRDSVLAEDPSGTQFAIPLNSNLKFVVAPMNVTEIGELPTAFCPTVADLVRQPHLPCVVKVVQDYNGETEYESVQGNTILFLAAMAEKDGKVTLIAKDVNGKEYGLREDCCAGFSLNHSDTWLFLSEIINNSTYPQRVFIITENLPARPLTLLSSERTNYLVASSDISGHHDYHSDFILEIPLHIDAEVECVAHNEKDNRDALKKAARAIYQRIKTQPGHLVSETPKSDSDAKFQEELYGAISDLVDLQSMRSNAVPKDLRLQVAPRPAARKNKSTSQVATSAVTSAPSPSPQSGMEDGQSYTSEHKSTVTPPLTGGSLKLHMMRSNRPLPPPPSAAMSYEFHVPSNIPATLTAGMRAPSTPAKTQPLPVLPDTDVGNAVYSTPSGLPVNGHPHSNSGETLLTNALYMNHNPNPPSPNQRPPAQIQTDCSTSQTGAQMSERPEYVHSHTRISQEQVPLPSIPLGSDILTDVREKLVVLENRMHSLYANHPNPSIMGPIGPYKEMEKELARVRGRQMKLEAHMAEYEKRLSKLEATSMQQATSSLSIPSDPMEANKAALLTLSQGDTAQVLVALRLECYCEQFAHEGIDGPVLACMTERTLDELGMSKMHQARLLPVVNGFRSATELLKKN